MITLKHEGELNKGEITNIIGALSIQMEKQGEQEAILEWYDLCEGQVSLKITPRDTNKKGD